MSTVDLDVLAGRAQTLLREGHLGTIAQMAEDVFVLVAEAAVLREQIGILEDEIRVLDAERLSAARSAEMWRSKASTSGDGRKIPTPPTSTDARRERQPGGDPLTSTSRGEAIALVEHALVLPVASASLRSALAEVVVDGFLQHPGVLLRLAHPERYR